jgi:selenocysteine lyase/cysteine desulfurase
MAGRVPTFLLTLEGIDAAEAARALAAQRIGVWAAGDWYCVGLRDRLPGRSLRIGIVHYNTAAEVDRLTAALAALARPRVGRAATA